MGHLAEITEFLLSTCQEGDLSKRLELTSAPSEVVALNEALSALLDKMWVNQFQLGAKQEMLEKLVEIRTGEVHEILNHVKTGFLLTLKDETVLDNFSHACTGIFGRSDLKGQKLSDLMQLPPAEKKHFSLAYEQIYEGFLPIEVALAQLPAEFTLDGRTYSVSAAPVFADDGQLVKLFFTISDTTEMRKLAHENALRHALIEIIRQRDAFAACLRETRSDFKAALSTPNQTRYRMVLHRAKGNMSCFGLEEVAKLIHSIEDFPEITPTHLQTVEQALRTFLESHGDVLGLAYADFPSQSNRATDSARVEELLEELVAQDSMAARRSRVDEYYRRATWIPTRVLLTPLRALFDRVAERLGKKATLTLIGQEILVEPDRMGKIFGNLGHLVRNSLDHGIEFPNERKGKPEVGRVNVLCRETPEDWIIEVSDDGRGIDVEVVSQAALEGGAISASEIAGMTRAERLRLVFAIGITTKNSANMISGRGIGMATLLESVQAENGEIAIHSITGDGTQVTIRIPKAKPDGATTVT